jgi:hypothetical protein
MLPGGGQQAVHGEGLPFETESQLLERLSEIVPVFQLFFTLLRKAHST